ncbi:hypothetical protein BJ875DRAFT_378951 [Amylocarpus encephaloides]|uniref:Peptidase A1 domain-containing protein n=1 Tax=Amylocarpus encephaloides TaxID=45428 RepID=A0A9P8C4L6_9HELO|nr:hypothetical protein BJ875DRAFT_378951 [Amylocarpus encephaloides]
MFPSYFIPTLVSLLSISKMVTASCSVGPHDAATITEDIDFTEVGYNFGANHPKAKVWFGKTKPSFPEDISTPRELIIDTGSTGIVLARSLLTNWDPLTEEVAAKEGYLFLSSSKRLYVGWWVFRNVYFNRDVTTTRLIKARTEILVLKEAINCTDYRIGSDGRTCPSGGIVDTNPRTALMGIGFGRTADGMEQSTPDRNPVLNIEAIRGTNVISNLAFSLGYIITKKGLTIGLTRTNYDLAGFLSARAPLPTPPSSIPPPPDHLRAYGQLPGCIKVAGIPSACVSCSVLLDTGVEQSYMRVEGDPASHSSWPFYPGWPVHKKGDPGTSDPSSAPKPPASILDTGKTVDIALGTARVAELVYTTDDGSPESPIWVNAYHDKLFRFPFVNTGRHVYRKYKVAFDPVCGTLAFVHV